jgi:hypothetical protein
MLARPFWIWHATVTAHLLAARIVADERSNVAAALEHAENMQHVLEEEKQVLEISLREATAHGEALVEELAGKEAQEEEAQETLLQCIKLHKMFCWLCYFASARIEELAHRQASSFLRWKACLSTSTGAEMASTAMNRSGAVSTIGDIHQRFLGFLRVRFFYRWRLLAEQQSKRMAGLDRMQKHEPQHGSEWQQKLRGVEAELTETETQLVQARDALLQGAENSESLQQQLDSINDEKLRLVKQSAMMSEALDTANAKAETALEEQRAAARREVEQQSIGKRTGEELAALEGRLAIQEEEFSSALQLERREHTKAHCLALRAEGVHEAALEHKMAALRKELEEGQEAELEKQQEQFQAELAKELGSQQEVQQRQRAAAAALQWLRRQATAAKGVAWGRWRGECDAAAGEEHEEATELLLRAERRRAAAAERMAAGRQLMAVARAASRTDSRGRIGQAVRHWCRVVGAQKIREAADQAVAAAVAEVAEVAAEAKLSAEAEVERRVQERVEQEAQTCRQERVASKEIEETMQQEGVQQEGVKGVPSRQLQMIMLCCCVGRTVGRAQVLRLVRRWQRWCDNVAPGSNDSTPVASPRQQWSPRTPAGPASLAMTDWERDALFGSSTKAGMTTPPHSGGHRQVGGRAWRRIRPRSPSPDPHRTLNFNAAAAKGFQTRHSGEGNTSVGGDGGGAAGEDASTYLAYFKGGGQLDLSNSGSDTSNSSNSSGSSGSSGSSDDEDGDEDGDSAEGDHEGGYARRASGSPGSDEVYLLAISNLCEKNGFSAEDGARKMCARLQSGLSWSEEELEHAIEQQAIVDQNLARTRSPRAKHGESIWTAAHGLSNIGLSNGLLRTMLNGSEGAKGVHARLVHANELADNDKAVKLAAGEEEKQQQQQQQQQEEEEGNGGYESRAKRQMTRQMFAAGARLTLILCRRAAHRQRRQAAQAAFRLWKIRTVVRVEVPGVQLTESGHAVYTVVTVCGGERHEALKRYSEFSSLARKLERKCPDLKARSMLPPKTCMLRGKNTDDFLQRRRKGLDLFLSSILYGKDISLVDVPHLASFLNVEI